MDCQTEAFPLEGKVANAMSRMRCSHRSGVIFLAMITAIAWPTPHHRRRRSLSSRRSLLVSASANYRHPPCLIITPNHAPVAANSAAGREGWRSQTEGEIFKGTDGACADPGTQNFPCHGGGAAGGQGHSQFNSINFYVTNRFFFSFLTQERNVSPRPFAPRHS